MGYFNEVRTDAGTVTVYSLQANGDRFANDTSYICCPKGGLST